MACCRRVLAGSNLPQAVEKLVITVIDNHCNSGHYYVHKFSPALTAGSPGGFMVQMFLNLCNGEDGQDIAEYAVMLAVILVLVIGTVRLIGGNANNAFSSVANSLQ